MPYLQAKGALIGKNWLGTYIISLRFPNFLLGPISNEGSDGQTVVLFSILAIQFFEFLSYLYLPFSKMFKNIST